MEEIKKLSVVGLKFLNPYTMEEIQCVFNEYVQGGDHGFWKAE
jgi:hypothetical protein